MTILVAAGIIHNKGKFLIAKRATHKHLGGFWEFPGGKIEENETPHSCLLRELNEELKIKVKIVRYLGENLHDYGNFTILLKAILCEFIEGEFTLIDHDEIKWVTAHQISDYTMSPADIPFLNFLEEIILPD